jgi:hypothetical protein
VNHPWLYEQFFLPVHIVVHIRIERARAWRAFRGKCAISFCRTWFVILSPHPCF